MANFQYVLVFVAIVLMGCASSRGFNRGELRDQMAGPAVVNELDIKKALALKAQLPKPFKLGVYFKEPQDRGRHNRTPWHWTDEDKNKILSAASGLKTSGEVSDVFVINDAAISGTELKSLRLAAARHGADALLVVTGINDLDRYNNNWSWTYVGIVTTLFVPASVNDSLFMVKASMWDVRNEFLYMTAEAESTKSLTRPAAFTNERDLTSESKAEAMNKLRDELGKMVASVGEKHVEKNKKR